MGGIVSLTPEGKERPEVHAMLFSTGGFFKFLEDKWSVFEKFVQDSRAMTSAENRNAVRAAEAKAKNIDEEKIIVVQKRGVRKRREFRGSVEKASASSGVLFLEGNGVPSSANGLNLNMKPEIVYAEGVDPDSIRPGSYEKYYFEKPVKEWIPAQPREQFSSYQDYFAFFLSGIASFLTSGAGWGLAIGTGRLNGNPNRVGSADVADVAVAAAAEEGENDMMKSVDAVTTIKLLTIFGIGLAAWSLAESGGALQLVPESTATGTGKRTARKTLIDDDFEKEFEQMLQRLGKADY